MKSYTDLEQSKKLAEILPIDSADMFYNEEQDETYSKDIVDTKYPMVIREGQKCYLEEYGIPCWSLAALLNIMPKHIKQNDGRTYKFHIFNDDGIVIQRWGCSYVAKDYHNRAEYLSDPTLKYPINIYANKHEDIIDACYEMILKLHELNLLKLW